jgi:D-amino peptidase
MMTRVSKLIVTGLLLAYPGVAQKRIFIITDAEGVAGVCHQDQIEPKGTDMVELLTGEINAAVDGFFDGGADEVIVLDGHSMAHNLSATTIHRRAKLIMGVSPINMTLDRKYTAMAFVGQHAMANVPKAIMGHSFSSLGIQTMKLNGKPVGEIGMHTAMAGEYGTPVIFLSGDQAAADEMLALVPKAATAVVKQGLMRNTCETLSAPAARDLIRAKAKASMALIGQLQPFILKAPVTLEVEFTTRNSLTPDAPLLPNTTVLDDRTIQYRGATVADAWRNYRSTRR